MYFLNIFNKNHKGLGVFPLFRVRLLFVEEEEENREIVEKEREKEFPFVIEYDAFIGQAINLIGLISIILIQTLLFRSSN